MSNLRRGCRGAAAVVLVVAGLLRMAPGPDRAGAAVGHDTGYSATVDGFASWYGSYRMGELGVAWCIDHGIRAPDPDLAYVPVGLEEVPVATRTALAWALGRHGIGPDRVGAAALMLVGHDLMAAEYPSGRLDVDALSEGSLAGFESNAPTVLARARAIKADALAHAHLGGPWALRLESVVSEIGRTGFLTATVTAGGTPVAGIDVAVRGEGAEPTYANGTSTGADGIVHLTYALPAGAHRFVAEATVPDLAIQAFAPTAGPAQRVARPATLPLTASLDRPAQTPPPTVTTTTAPPVTTSTTIPPTTTTSTSTTTPPTTTTSTAAPPTTTTSTTAPPTTTTSTTAPPTTTTTAPPTTTTSTPPPTTTTSTPPPTTTTSTAPVPLPPPAPAPPSLPRTGGDPLALAATGTGLVLLGSSLRPWRRRRPS